MWFFFHSRNNCVNYAGHAENIKSFKYLRLHTYAVPREHRTSVQNDVMDLARTQRNNRKANAGQANTCLHPGTQTLRSLRWFTILLGPSQLGFIYPQSCVCIPVISEMLFPLSFLILCPFCIHTFCQLTGGRECLQAPKRPGSAKGQALANGSGWNLLGVLPLPISFRRHCMLCVRASPCPSSGLGNLPVQGQWTMHGALLDPTWS